MIVALVAGATSATAANLSREPGPTLSSGSWELLNRSTVGSPSAFLRSGPSTPDVGPIPAQAPPAGTGSLNLVVSGPPTTPAGQGEKVAYGNDFDFVGDSFQDLTAVGFHVYRSPENSTPRPDGEWGGTGAEFTACNIDGTLCTFDELQQFLADNNDGTAPTTIGSVAITKGRDFAWQGAVDGLRINDTVYDFEETGVVERAP